jgi:hypothetical protein
MFNGGPGGIGSMSKRRAEMGPALRTKEGHAVIDQADMYAHVFLPLDDDKVLPAVSTRPHWRASIC